MTEPAAPNLGDLRQRIDQLDAALIAIVAERLAVCREVAEVKQLSDTPVIQPARVRDVVTSRRRQAIEAGVDADFAEQLFSPLTDLAEIVSQGFDQSGQFIVRLV